jgi:hypothetical protein
VTGLVFLLLGVFKLQQGYPDNAVGRELGRDISQVRRWRTPRDVQEKAKAAEAAGKPVGLRGSGGASLATPSVAHHQALCRSCVDDPVTDVRRDVRHRCSTVDPERLLKASLRISLYSVLSERAFCEQMDFDLLWRWFLHMSLMDPSFGQSTFGKNRGRLLNQRTASPVGLEPRTG